MKVTVKSALLFTCTLILAPFGAAQVPCAMPGVEANVTPAVAPLGQPLAVTLSNNTNMTIHLPSSCVYSGVFSGAACGGTPVFAPGCGAVIISIPPGGSETMPWGQHDNSGQPVGPGTYSFEILFFDDSFNLMSCCVSATVVPRAGTAYCFGAAACPCGNFDFFAGCANSTSSGALLLGTGSASVGADDLVLTATGVPPGQNGILYMGGAADFAPFGDGHRCVAAGSAVICRFPVQSAGNAGTLTEGPGIVAFSQTLGLACHVDPGDTWYFQGWYRDPGGPCGAFFNLSNAYSVTFTP